MNQQRPTHNYVSGHVICALFNRLHLRNSPTDTLRGGSILRVHESVELRCRQWRSSGCEQLNAQHDRWPFVSLLLCCLTIIGSVARSANANNSSIELLHRFRLFGALQPGALPRPPAHRAELSVPMPSCAVSIDASQTMRLWSRLRLGK